MVRVAWLVRLVAAGKDRLGQGLAHDEPVDNSPSQAEVLPLRCRFTASRGGPKHAGTAGGQQRADQLAARHQGVRMSRAEEPLTVTGHNMRRGWLPAGGAGSLAGVNP